MFLTDLDMDDHGSSDVDSDCENQFPRDPCYRCAKTVYPVEKVDVGVLFHRRCFRCRSCGLQLTLRTFHWDQDKDPDVYCQVHVSKLVGSIDKDAIGIKSVLNTPKKGKGPQPMGNQYNPVWQFGSPGPGRSKDMDNKRKTSLGTYKDFESFGVFDAQTTLEKQQKMEEDLLYEQFREERDRWVRKIEKELQIEKEKSVSELIKSFEKMASKNGKIDISQEKERLENMYRKKKEERLANMIGRLSLEEKGQVTRLIEKHSQEMLLLIAEKLNSYLQSSSESDDSPVQEVATLTRPPPIAPPEYRRSQLFKTAEEFDVLDSQVFEVAQKEYFTFTDLVKDLIQRCQTDLEKARAIFRWITVKDLNKMDIAASVNPESPLGLLRGIKYGTETYHDLFKRLCSYAGIYCEIIQGLSKGAGYKPGMKLDGEKFRNSWTAVFIEGSWCFINCNWGARHVKNSSDKELDATTGLSKFYYKCDEFYFVTDPEDHIHQHFPDNPKWQLLECPITLTEFINLPVIKSPFVNYGLKFANHYDGTQYTSNGVVMLQLKIPNLLGFGYTLDAKDPNMDPCKLEGRVMLRIIGHQAIFTVAPPKPGTYYFTIYSKDDWNSESLQSACAFRIKCREKRENIKSPFPKVSFYGPTPCLSHFGVSPQTHIDPLVIFSYDDLIIQFQLHKDNVSLSHSLQYHGPFQADNIDFQRFVFVSYRDDNTAAYQVRCPIMGKYVFSLFGSSTPSSPSESQHHECLFRYMVDCKQPAKDKRPLPRACHRWFMTQMLEPTVGDLGVDRIVNFRLRAPMALDVALMIGDAWFHFRELADGIWEGSVNTGKDACKAKLYAKLSKEKSRFSPLIEYNIVK